MVEVIALSSFTEPLTLGLIVVTGAVFLAMALKVRSIRSLQVQFSIGVLVWVGSEIPHILGTIGFVDIQATYEDIGLWFHFFSMFLLAAFIVFRIPRLLGVLGRTEGLVGAVVGGLRNALGESGARAATFYLNVGMARDSPRSFIASLRRVFGDGSVLLEQKIAESLVSSGLADQAEVASGSSLADLLAKAGKKA